LLALTVVTIAAPSASALWAPKVGDTWNYILTGVVDVSKPLVPDVLVYDIDLVETSKDTIDKLHSMGKKVVCYFSAGTSDSRRADNAQLLPYAGNVVDGFPDERWLQISTEGVHSVMRTRIALAAAKGCDAIEPDNMDGYDNDNGLGLTTNDTIRYVNFLSVEAASKGMSIGLKNAGEVIDWVIGEVAFAINEQCNEEEECETWDKFINAEPPKPVFNVEYVDSEHNSEPGNKASCPTNRGFSSIIKRVDLDGFTQSCNGKIVTTPTKPNE